MNEFWEWMDRKGYGFTKAVNIPQRAIYVGESFLEESQIPKQMLIGYMIEYLMNSSLERNVTYDSIDDLYNDLKKTIK